MIRSHKIKLNPTSEQAGYFRKACGTVRFTYNWGLARWKELYEAGERPSAYSLKKEFNAIKHEQFPWVSEVSGRCTEYGFVRLGRAFANFFRRVKQGDKEVGYPRFKSRYDSHQSFYVANDGLKFDGHFVKIPRVTEPINMAEPLRFEGKVMNGVISTSGDGRWYLSVAVDVGDVAEPINGDPVGIDLGIKTRAVLSDGAEFENFRHLQADLRKLKRFSRELARREKGSNRWLATKKKINRLHTRIRNRRADDIHKMTTAVTKKYGLIGLESLNVKGMMSNHHLAQAISDVGMFEVKRQLTYKAELYGAEVVEVDRWFPSSRLCSACGWKHSDLALADRSWTCPECGSVHDRDLNAAINILHEALRIKAEIV